MDDYFIENIDWKSCIHPINAIDFSTTIDSLEELAFTLEMLGLTLYEPILDTYYNNQGNYLTLHVKGNRVEFSTCGDRIAPVPAQYVSTLIPALILAHIDNPVNVKQTYNDFFINKKEEITPLLNK